MIVSLAFNGLKFIQQQKEDDAIRQQQILQNQIAERDRITAEAREKFRIRKEVQAEKKKAFLVAQEADAKRAAAIASAETVGGKSVDDLIIDFYRQEGQYEASVLEQIDNAVFASALNLEDIRNRQIAQQTYVMNSQTLPNLAAGAINISSDYLQFKSDQEMKDILKSQTDEYFG